MSSQRLRALSAVHRGFETCLWSSRFLAIIAVVASLLAATALFVVAAIDAMQLGRELLTYLLSSEDGRQSIKNDILMHVAGEVDTFLFATILLMFGFGIYELFVDRLHVSERMKFADRILIVNNIDDLKDRLSKVIFLMLIVRYFEHALEAPATTSTELLQLAAGIVLVALALYLTKGAPALPLASTPKVNVTLAAPSHIA
jgi:uncharacterized membrane protein YqhA